jgi:enoyl-CoA hydratase/carnithine racemase
MTVKYEVSEGRATVTIDDPERRNPMSVTTMAGLLARTQEALADPHVRVIVYTGAGEEAFCAGGDLSGSFVDDPIGLHHGRGDIAHLFRSMMGGGKPTIARVNGHAIAGGLGLAVACDITICVDDAKLGTSEVKVGLWPMMISAMLVRAMPRKAALEMMLTGRLIDPEEALRLGLVSRVVPRRELDQTVDEVVSSLMELSPSTLMLGKDSFHGMADSALDTALDRLQGGLTEIASTDDAAEGVAAFIEKRAPDWSGR